MFASLVQRRTKCCIFSAIIYCSTTDLLPVVKFELLAFKRKSYCLGNVILEHVYWRVCAAAVGSANIR